MRPDWPAIREAIALLLEQVPEIKRVERYQRDDLGTNNLPAATIWLGPITRPGYDDSQSQLLAWDHKAEWVIHVKIKMSGIGDEIRAQQTYELLATNVRNTFDTQPLLQPNGAGAVHLSAITSSDLVVTDIDSPEQFALAVFTLETFLPA